MTWVPAVPLIVLAGLGVWTLHWFAAGVCLLLAAAVLRVGEEFR